MLSRGGFRAMVGALGLLGAGKVLGATELYLLGAGLTSLIGVALLWVRLTRVHLNATRRVGSGRIHRGALANVELTITNEAARRSTTVKIRDALSGTSGAAMLIGPLARGEGARAAYQLPTGVRGVLTVGPLDVQWSDPFGLCTRRKAVLGETELLVYPQIEVLLPVAHASRHDPVATARNPNALAPTGDDFFALRRYVIGDDLRRVHWPSLARGGELLTRQHEQTRHEATTVMLNVEQGQLSSECFEQAVSAAASVLAAASAASDDFRLCTSAGADCGFTTGRAQLDGLLAALAVQQPQPNAALASALDRLTRTEAGGSLVVIGADAEGTETLPLAALRRSFAYVVTVAFALHDPAGHSPESHREDGAGAMLVCSPGESFVPCWNQSQRRVVAHRRRLSPGALGGTP